MKKLTIFEIISFLITAIILTLFVFVISSCNDHKIDEGKIYLTIPAGEKECTNPLRPHINSDYMDVWIYVDSSWMYVKDNNATGVAKVVGYSEGLLHRQNSIRIGWEYHNGTGDFCLFKEVDKGDYTRVQMNMEIVYNAWYYFRLAEIGDEYILRCDNQEAKCLIHKDRFLGYITWPSMAGGYTLIHNWNIILKFEY